MNLGRLIAPNLLTHLPEFFPSLATFQQNTATPSTTGQMTASWSDVDGLTDIPCVLEKGGGHRERTATSTYNVERQKVSLNAYFDTIQPEYRVVIDDEQFYIEDILSDSQKVHSIIALRRLQGE